MLSTDFKYTILFVCVCCFGITYILELISTYHQVSFSYPEIKGLVLVTFGMPRTLANKEQEADLAEAAAEAVLTKGRKGNKVLKNGGALKNDSNGYYQALAAGASHVQQ